MFTYTRITKTLLLALILIPFHLWAASPTSDPYLSKIEQIVSGLNARDYTPFITAIDSDRILDTSLSGLIIGAKWKDSFRKGIKAAIKTRLGQQIVGQIPASGYAKLLRIKQNGDIRQALIRIDLGDSGNSYMDMHLYKADNGRVSIIDWFSYATGQLYTETLRQAAASMSPTPTLLGKVFDIASDRKSSIDVLQKLFLMHRDGKHAQMVKQFLSLDEELKKSRLLNIVAFQSANISGDMDLYSKVLTNIEKYFGDDESMAFVLIDYYYLKGDYAEVIKTAERLQSSFGVEDAALTVFKANALLEMNNNLEAAQQARHAIDLEPEYEYAYLSLLTAQVQSKAFGQAVNTAKKLESGFSYDFSQQSLSGNDFYRGFIKSAEYSKWKGAKY